MDEFEDYAEIFFWDFKRRDNVVYNFSIIETLISDAIDNPESSNFYYKPVFITIMAIIECIIYDLLVRIQEHTKEKVHLNENDIKNIKNIDLPSKLKCYNDICKKYKLLSLKSINIHQSIEELIEIRNRIHIQNAKSIKPLDERDVWTPENIKKAGSILQNLVLFLSKKYPRPDHIHSSPDLDLFPTPWDNL